MRRTYPSQVGLLLGRTALVAVILHLASLVSAAGPEGAEIVHGSAQFDRNGNYTAIHASDKAVINYRRFDITRPETVEFIQPSDSASVLNRILSANPTRIDGTLLANGRVFFVNPAGVIFGESAQVNVTQLVASALDISNADFISGNYVFSGGSGDVVNKGNIQARERAYLIGKQVANLGNIDCPGGYVILASGDRVFLGAPGSDLLVEVTASPPPVGQEGVAEGSALTNEGAINVGQGKIVLAAAGDLYSQAILNAGRLSASRDDGDAGEVELSATDGRVVNRGSIEATSNSGAGGIVTVDSYDVISSGTVDVSGASAAAPGGAIVIEAEAGVTLEELNAGAGTIDIQVGRAGTDTRNAMGTLTGEAGVSITGGAGDDAFVVSAPEQAYSLDAGAGSDKMILLGTDNDDSIRLDAPTGFSTAQGAIDPQNFESYEVEAGGGDDTLTVDFDGGNPIPVDGLIYDGQGEATDTGDALVVRGGSFETATLSFSGPKSGAIVYDGNIRIEYTDLEPIEDTTTAANLAIPGPTAGADTISVVDGTGVDAGVTNFTEVDFGGAAESYTFANKTNVTLDALDGGDTITVNNPNAADGLSSFAIDAGAGDDALTMLSTGGVVTYTLTGNTGTDTLVGPSAANTWSVTGADAGTLNGDGFTGFENLTGGGDDDVFTFGVGGNLSGLIDGGAHVVGDSADYSALAAATVTLGTDVTNVETLTGAAGDADFTLANGSVWSITGVDDGTVDGITFTDWANATGTAGADTFTVTGTLSGTIDGQGGADSADYSGAAPLTVALVTDAANVETLTGGGAGFTLSSGSTWSITGGDDGTVDGIAFTDWANATGTGGADAFTLNGGTLSGAIDGAGGTDTLTGDNVANTFTVTGANSGTATGVTGGFSNVENLTGNAQDDAFALTGGTLGGAIDGAGGTDTVTGDNVVNTFTVTGANSGTATGVTGGFSNVENLTGNAQDDTFTVTGTLSGTIDGQGGTDSADYSGAAPLTVVLVTDVTNVETLTGGGAGFTLSNGSTWSISGADDGTVDGITFTDWANATGTGGADTFTLNGGTLSGAIDGAGGTDTLTGDNVANTFTVTGTNSGTATGVTGGFSNVENLTGNAQDDAFALTGGTLGGAIDGAGGTDTLMGDNVANTFVMTSVGGGTATGTGGFSNIEHLTGNAQNDSLTVDFSGPDPIPSGGLTYDGKGQTGAPGDSLSLTGGSFTTVTYNFTNTGAEGHDGSIDLDGSLITFAGLEPISSNGTATNVIFNLSALADTAQLEDASGGRTTLDDVAGTTFEDTTFTNPTGSLTVNAGGGDDSVTVASLDAGFGASLTLDGQGGSDALSLPNGLTIGSALVATGEMIELGGTIATGSTQTYAGPATLGTDTALTGSEITFGQTLDGTTDFAEDLTLTVGTGNVNFNGAVGGTTNLGDVSVNSATSVTISGPFNADNITITASDSHIDINGDVTAAGDLELNNTTVVADDTTLTAGVDLSVGAGKTLVAEGGLLLEAAHGRISEKAGDDGRVQIEMPAGGERLTLTQLDALDMDTFDVTNAGSTDLVASSGGAIADAAADGWHSTAAAAGRGIALEGAGNITTNALTSTANNISVRSTGGDLIVQGDITANGGGISLVSDHGGIYSTASGEPLDTSITGYSDHDAGEPEVMWQGVDLDLDGSIPGKAAILIVSEDDLAFGEHAVLDARGVYDVSRLVFPDDRAPSDLEFDGPMSKAGDPIDIAIYLKSESGNVTVNAGEISIDYSQGPPEQIGTLAVDARDTVRFEGSFTGSLRVQAGQTEPTSSLRRIEAVSRVSETLQQAQNYTTDPTDDKLPFAHDPENAVTYLWGDALLPGTYAYQLRGPQQPLDRAERLAISEIARIQNLAVVRMEIEDRAPVRRRENPVEDIEARYPGLLRLPVPNPHVMASDIELRKTAEHFQELERGLREHEGTAIEALNERAGNWRNLPWDANSVSEVEREFEADPALRTWMSHAFDFVWTAKTRCGHSTEFARGVFISNFVRRPPAGADAYRAVLKYLDAKLRLMSGR